MLSAFVRQYASAVDSSLERLTCVSQGIAEIDIHPTVLTVLTNPAKRDVPASVSSAAVQHLAGSSRHTGSSSSPSAPRTRSLSREARATADAHEDEGDIESMHGRAGQGFNVAIAFSLHTVLLSRNKLRDILGIVQFKHVVHLSLLGNRIDTIEACEPLSLLPQLAYLSLEFNPVTTLPHYQAHILRICSWPKPLAARSCRLKKLDAVPVTADMVQQSIRCLLSEATLLPELSHRIRLVCFLSHVARQQRVIAEMCRQGFLPRRPSTSALSTAAPTEAATQPVMSGSDALDKLFERCGETAARALDASDAAHLCRVLVRDHQCAVRRRHHRRITRGSTQTHADDSGEDEDSIERAQWSSITSLLLAGEEDEDGQDGCEDSCGGESTCELLSEVSDILLSRQLYWQTSSAKRAPRSLQEMACAEWSMDWFRVTISSVDVHLCRLLLRVAQTRGTTIGSTDVDRLLRKWLQLLVATKDTATDTINVTGKRRRMVSGVSLKGARVEAVSKPMHGAPSRLTTVQSTDTSVVSAITHESEDARDGRSRDTQLEDGITPIRTQQPERSARTTPSTLVVDLDEDDDGSAPLTATAWTPEVKSTDRSDENDVLQSEDASSTVPTQAPSTSTSAPTELEPRTSVPVAAPSSSPLRSDTLGKPPLPPSAQKPKHPEEPRSLHPSSSSGSCAHSEGDDDTSVCVLRALQFQIDHWKRRVWRQWQLKLCRSAQDRRCDVFIRARLDTRLGVRPGSPLLHACLSRMPYTERKRVFFDHWRMLYEAAQVTRAVQRQARFRHWYRRFAERRLIQEADELARATQRAFVFRTWRDQVVSRRLILPKPAATPSPRSHQPVSDLSRVLAAPLSEQGIRLSGLTAAQTVDVPQAGVPTGVPLLEAALKGELPRPKSLSPHTTVILSPEKLAEMDTDAQGLSPSHALSHGDRSSPSHYGLRLVRSRSLPVSSPVLALDGLSSYHASPVPRRPASTSSPQSACRYADYQGTGYRGRSTADGEPSADAWLSLPKDRSLSLRPPPPLDYLHTGTTDGAFSVGATQKSRTRSRSALRWSNVGLSRSVASAACLSGHRGVVLAPAALAQPSSPPLSSSPAAAIGGPYPEEDVEALVWKAGCLQREHQQLTAAIRNATEKLQAAEQERAVATDKAEGVEKALLSAQSCVTSLQDRICALTSEMSLLEKLVETLRQDRRERWQRAVEGEAVRECGSE